MNTNFASMLAVDGKKNSLGLVNDVIGIILKDQSGLEELYETVFHEDAWVRMRAIDAFEKICREHPEWIAPYVDRIQRDLAVSSQASIQWHIAQIYEQVDLNERQKTEAIEWLKAKLSTTEVDWIVAANCMKALAYFTRKGDFKKHELAVLLKVQAGHKSNAIVKRSQKLLQEFS